MLVLLLALSCFILGLPAGNAQPVISSPPEIHIQAGCPNGASCPTSGSDIRHPVQDLRYPFNAIGLLSSPDFDMKCTGALLDPTHVLTSGHCAYDSELAKLLTQRMTFQPGARVDAQTGKVTELLGLYNVLSANIPTEWEKDGSTDHDFAVLGLDKPVVLPGGGPAGFSHGCQHLSPFPKFPAPIKSVENGDGLFIAGYPTDLNFTYSSAICTVPKIDFSKAVFTEKCDAQQGMQGAPMWVIEPGSEIRRICGVHRGVLPKLDTGSSDATDGQGLSTNEAVADNDSMEEFISKVLSTPPATILPAEAPAPMSLIAPNAPAPTPAPIQAPILPPIAPTTSPPFPPPIPAPTPAVSPTPPPVAGAPPPMALQTVEQPGGSCQIERNANYKGGLLAPPSSGPSNIKSTVDECCGACLRTKSCATFVYCERSGGCPVANGKTLLQGQCDLKADAAVTANPNAPVEVFGRGPAVTLTSGKVASKSP